jgi:hypothetical protein
MTARLGPDVGRELLDELGFLHVPGAFGSAATSYLFVALRPRPTLQHFDPERVDYWVSSAGHGQPAEIAWPGREATVGDYSWGIIRVVDRVNETNEFASFGGSLLVARLAEVKTCVFSSEAPILACGGHSQAWQPGGREVAAFIARLRAAADPRGTLEAELCDLSPVARYAAFVHDGLERVSRSGPNSDWPVQTRSALERERSRLRADQAREWAAGVNLAERLTG